jgi:PBSX family phage terminase large subunit
VSNSTAKLNIIQSNGFGVANYFAGRCREGQYQDRDALYINTKVGEKVIIIGGGANKASNKLIKGFTLGSIYVSEANECDESFIKECFDRTISSNLRKIFFDINPKNPQDYFYTEILDVHEENSLTYKNYGYVWQHFTIADNMSITDERMAEILTTYRRNSIWWERDIAGLRTAAEGIVYSNFTDKNKYVDGDDHSPNFDLYYNRHYVIDYGTIHPFACLEMIEQTIEGVTNYYCNDEYYYDSTKTHKELAPSDYADAVEKFIDGKRTKAIIVDPAAADFRAELRKHNQRSKETAPTINADNEVVAGIRLVTNLLQTKKLWINKKCVNLIKELSAYIWDAKAAEHGKEQVVKVNDDACDCLRYYCKTIVKSYKI